VNTIIDLAGALLSIISGYFYIKERPVAWLISLAAIPFDVIMDISIGVYGDLFLQFVYFVLLVYGWYAWRSGQQVEEGLPIIRMSGKQFYGFTLLSSIFVIGIWYSLNTYTNSEVALMDSMVTCLSLVAMWLLCRKIIESWLLWIFVDCLYAVLFVYKQMPFHGVMALFDAGVCVMGYLYWVREHRGTLAQVEPDVSFEDAVPQAE
jgi:nicotinamide mononucleotide transporter